MSPVKREFILYLEDMLQSMERIEEYLGDLDFRKFKMNYLVVDAIIRNFEIIGEASKNIPSDIKEKYPEIPWRKMYGLRNLIAHEYFGIDYEMIWEIAVFLNQLHALSHSAYPVREVEKNLNKLIKELEKGIDNINRAIERLISEDEKLGDRVSKILKIKGVGIKTVAVLLAETNGFETFENQGQLVSYSGYDIVENQSGKYHGKTKMSKKGNAHIRRAMHLPAFGVVRFQQGPFKHLYNRLISRGKTKMQAYVAVQRKLLILIWALWKKDKEYDPNYHLTHQQYSGNDEPKPLFSLGSEGDTKKVGPASTGPTVDELPCNESPEALFSLT